METKETTTVTRHFIEAGHPCGIPGIPEIVTEITAPEYKVGSRIAAQILAEVHDERVLIIRNNLYDKKIEVEHLNL
jgi:hypothetical protein